MNIIRQQILETVTKQPTTLTDLSRQYKLPREYIQTVLVRLIEDGHSLCIEKEEYVYIAKDRLLDYMVMVSIPLSLVGLLVYGLSI